MDIRIWFLKPQHRVASKSIRNSNHYSNYLSSSSDAEMIHTHLDDSYSGIKVDKEKRFNMHSNLRMFLFINVVACVEVEQYSMFRMHYHSKQTCVNA